MWMYSFLAEVSQAEEQVKDTLEDANEKTNLLIQYIKGQMPVVIDFVEAIIFAILIYLVGKKVIKILMRLIDRSFEKGKMDESVAHFLHSVIQCCLYVLLVFILAGIVGVGTSSIIAMLGSAGLAIGLALQGSLANFAGGVLILLMKPYSIGDFINVTGMEGTVISIDIFYTKLQTYDNKVLVIPNGTISNSSITNLTTNPFRMLDMEFSIDYTDDLKQAKEVLLTQAAGELSICKDDETMPVKAFVKRLDSSCIVMGLRAWVSTEEYFDTMCRMQESIKEAFDKNGITIPYNHLDVKICTEKE